MSPWEKHRRDFLERTRFGSLDGLRFLAVVPVVFHHSTPHPLAGILGKGPLGVDLFFAISGLLITTLLLRERERRGTVEVRAFYMRRARRILPLYYAVLGLTVVRALVLPADSPVRAHFFASLPFFATFTTTWFVRFGVPHPVLFAYSWSLAVEEQFYAVWPWIVRRGSAFAFAAVLVLLAVDVAAGAGHLSSLGALAVTIATSLRPPLLFGVLFACVLHTERGYRVMYALLGSRLAIVVVALLLAVALGTTWIPLLGTQLLLALLVAASVIREDHALSAPLTARPIVWIGQASYGVYMLHLAAIFLAKQVVSSDRANGAYVFALAFPLSLLFAAASKRWFEARFLDSRPAAGRVANE